MVSTFALQTCVDQVLFAVAVVTAVVTAVDIVARGGNCGASVAVFC